VNESSTGDCSAAKPARENLISLFADRSLLIAAVSLRQTIGQLRFNSLWKFIPTRMEVEITCCQRW
jgi:hypothetical protein